MLTDAMKCATESDASMYDSVICAKMLNGSLASMIDFNMRLAKDQKSRIMQMVGLLPFFATFSSLDTAKHVVNKMLEIAQAEVSSLSVVS